MWTPHTFYIILHIQISLVQNFSSNRQFLFSGSNLHKKVFLVKNYEKVNIIIGFHIFKLVSWYPNSALTNNFWLFSPDLCKKGFSGLKQKKWTSHIFYIILHIQISLVRNFSSNWQFLFFGPNLPKKVFPVKNRKSEHNHGILHIWISLGTKFQLKLIILSFWTKFTQKRYFQLKTEQAVQGLQAFAFCVVNVNSTVVFKHFEDLKDLIILNILKEKLVMSCLLGSFYLKILKSFLNSTVEIAMISKVMIKFRSKFLYNFTGQLKMLKLVMVMVKSFDQYLFNLSILVTILLFYDWDSNILNIMVL